MQKFTFSKQEVNDAMAKDYGFHGDGNLRTLVRRSNVPAQYQGRVANALLNGVAKIDNGTITVTIDD